MTLEELAADLAERRKDLLEIAELMLERRLGELLERQQYRAGCPPVFMELPTDDEVCQRLQRVIERLK